MTDEFHIPFEFAMQRSDGRWRCRAPVLAASLAAEEERKKAEVAAREAGGWTDQEQDWRWTGERCR